MQIERRTFLKHTAAGAMLSCFPASLTATERAAAGPLERRTLGRTGEKLSIIGFGGIVSYAVDGTQYIAAVSGTPSSFWVDQYGGSPTVVVFKLQQ